MRRLYIQLRLFALLFQTAPPFPTRALVPSLALVIIYIGLILGGASIGVAVTLGVMAAILLRALPRLAPTAAQISHSVGPAAAAVSIGLVFGLPLAIVLWQMDTRWSQHLVTFGSLSVALVRLIDIADGRYTAARMTWPQHTAAWPMLTRVMFLSALAFALLNETILRVTSLEIWIAWVALMPVFSHYVTAALTTTVFLELDKDA